MHSADFVIGLLSHTDIGSGWLTALPIHTHIANMPIDINQDCEPQFDMVLETTDAVGIQQEILYKFCQLDVLHA